LQIYCFGAGVKSICADEALGPASSLDDGIAGIESSDRSVEHVADFEEQFVLQSDSSWVKLVLTLDSGELPEVAEHGEFKSKGMSKAKV
jgi:hypothetical protein